MRSIFLLYLLSVVNAEAQDPAVLSERAQQCAEQNRGAEAEKLWLQAIGLSPNYFPALFNLGYFYFQEGRMSDAEPLLRRASMR